MGRKSRRGREREGEGGRNRVTRKGSMPHMPSKGGTEKKEFHTQTTHACHALLQSHCTHTFVIIYT